MFHRKKNLYIQLSFFFNLFQILNNTAWSVTETVRYGHKYCIYAVM